MHKYYSNSTRYSLQKINSWLYVNAIMNKMFWKSQIHLTDGLIDGAKTIDVYTVINDLVLKKRNSEMDKKKGFLLF